MFESYRKLRNTLRYLVGNLHDYTPSAHKVAAADLPEIDQWMLAQLDSLKAEVHDAYESFQFYRASQALMRFAVSDLSNFYLDIAKDRHAAGWGEGRGRGFAQGALLRRCSDGRAGRCGQQGGQGSTAWAERGPPPPRGTAEHAWREARASLQLLAPLLQLARPRAPHSRPPQAVHLGAGRPAPPLVPDSAIGSD